MKSRNPRLALAAAAIAAATIASACSTGTQGVAVPAPGHESANTTTEPRSTTKQPPKTSVSNSGGLAKLDPCDALTPAGKSQLGLTGEGVPDDLGSGRSCVWKQRVQEDLYHYGITLYDKSGLKDLPDDLNKRELPPINGREAVQIPSLVGGSCSVNVAVTEKSNAMALVVAGANRAKACELALSLAEAFEPQLP
ncbi:DUF3558 domain-containing protein [Actinokineospora auranticolor]|uniref:DUF3558 domain-containing protein n=1 Tax=Actinokineospora auranticolor TaxID=155976 RepID=UPI001FE30785|nr:DUF3558 domain-containing protein [Actinokineospora auranticolor]